MVIWKFCKFGLKRLFPPPKFAFLGIFDPKHYFSSSRPSKAHPWANPRRLSIHREKPSTSYCCRRRQGSSNIGSRPRWTDFHKNWQDCRGPWRNDSQQLLEFQISRGQNFRFPIDFAGHRYNSADATSRSLWFTDTRTFWANAFKMHLLTTGWAYSALPDHLGLAGREGTLCPSVRTYPHVRPSVSNYSNLGLRSSSKANSWLHPYIPIFSLNNVKCKSDYGVRNDESLRGHCRNARRVRKRDKKVKRDVI